MASGNLLNSAGSSVQCSVMTWRDGMWPGGGRKAQEGGDMCRHIDGSLCWRAETRVLQSEISQVEKNQILFIINTHMWNLRGLFYIHHLQGINFISTRCYTFFPLVYHFLGKKVNYDFIWLLLSSISHFTN